jgi:hypothetical protein
MEENKIMEKFKEGRIYRSDKGKIICIERSGQYAKFVFYLPWHDLDTPDIQEILKINISESHMYECVFSDWFAELHSTDYVIYTEQLIDILETIGNSLTDAEIIEAACENIILPRIIYYKFQRTKYSKPIYFTIDSYAKIELIDSEEYEEKGKKEVRVNIDALSNILNKLIIESNANMD